MSVRAKMKDNLVARYKEILPLEFTAKTGEFLESIEGKYVDLKFRGFDAFEKNTDKVWLPSQLWEE